MSMSPREVREREALIHARERAARGIVETPLEHAWEADARAKREHTYEAWMAAAAAFEEAGRPDIARELREHAKPLRKNLSRKDLLHAAIRAATEVFRGKKRP